MKIAISQPTYLPWQGYFALIDYVDEFIFLENVQFNKRSWQQRNRIINQDEEIFLTMPVKSKGKFYQKISDVEISEFDIYKKKHISIIKSSYSKCEYFKKYFFEIENIFSKDYIKLSELNKDLIKHICKILKIETNFSSDKFFSLKTHKTDYLKDICIKKNCTNYISTLGSKKYLGESLFFNNTNIKIDYYDFKDSKYVQQSENFIPRLSIIDALFSLGPNTLEYLRKNFILCK